MSDNIVKLFAGQKNKKRTAAVIGIAVLVLCILVLVLFWNQLNMDKLVRRMKYHSNGSSQQTLCQFDSHSTNHFVWTGSGLAMVNSAGLHTYEPDGNALGTFDKSMQNPAVMTGGDLTVFYDIGGTDLTAVEDGKKVVMEFTADGSIFHADVSDGETVCIAAAESGYKTVLRAFDSAQNEIFRWYSSSQVMPLCAISPNGKHMAAISLGQSNGAFDSTLNLFRTDSEDIDGTVSLGDRLVYGLHFTDNGTICAVCEDEILFLTTSGETVGTYDMSNWYLQDFDLGGDGFVLTSLNMYKAGNRCSVTAVDDSGEELGSVFLGEEVADISAAGSYVAVLTTETLTIYRRDLSLYQRADNSWMATSVLMREDGTAVLISNNAATLYIP